MSEINEYGYQKLREFIKSSWQYIELQDKNGNAIIRKQATVLNHTDGENIIKLQVVVNGNEIGANETTPVTVAKMALYDVATGGEPIANKDFDVADITTLTQDVDQLTVVHSIEVPQIDSVEESDDEESDDSDRIW